MSLTMIMKAMIPVSVLLYSDQCGYLTRVNCCVQLLLFLLTSHLPSLLTSRMSYVDVSWPWGLVMIGFCPLVASDHVDTRTVLVSGMVKSLATPWNKKNYYRCLYNMWIEDGTGSTADG